VSEWLDRVYLEGPVRISSQTAPGSFCRLHIISIQGSSLKEHNPTDH